MKNKLFVGMVVILCAMVAVVLFLTLHPLVASAIVIIAVQLYLQQSGYREQINFQRQHQNLPKLSTHETKNGIIFCVWENGDFKEISEAEALKIKQEKERLELLID